MSTAPATPAVNPTPERELYQLAIELHHSGLDEADISEQLIRFCESQWDITTEDGYVDCSYIGTCDYIAACAVRGEYEERRPVPLFTNGGLFQLNVPRQKPATDNVQQRTPRIFENQEEALAAFNRMFCFVVKADAIVSLSDFEVYNPDSFVKRQFVNWKYKYVFTDANGDTKTRYGNAAKHWLSAKERLQRHRMTYAPGKGRFAVADSLNRWCGWGSQPKAGDVSMWHQLMDFLFPSPEARMHFEQWVAYQIQHPGTRLATAIVLCSLVQGIGKSILLEAIRKIFGLNAGEIERKQLDSDFNPWLLDKQLIVGEEIHGGRDKKEVIERLKMLITSPTVTINEKHKPQFTVPNVANFVFLTNNLDAFHLVDQDRRFWVWEIPQEQPLPDEFYQRFKNWKESTDGIAALHHYLLNLDLAGFNPDAKAPMTQAKEDMIELSRTEVERWLRDFQHGSHGRSLFTADDLSTLWQQKNSSRNDGTAAILRALNKIGFKKAHGGKQIKVNKDQLRLWVVAEPDEAARWHKMSPAELSAAYLAQKAAFRLRFD